MNGKRLLRSGWFWAAVSLTVVAAGVFGYTLSLRHEVEQLTQDQLVTARQLVNLLKTIPHQTDLETAWAKVQEYQEQSHALAKRGRSLPHPSTQLQQELSQRYGPQWHTVIQDFQHELERLKKLNLPGGQQFCEKLEKLSPGASWTLDYQEQSP
jgi:hypothetical protein